MQWKKPTYLDKDKCLVISTTGLGDSLWASAPLLSMKQKKPHLKIDLLTSPVGEQVLYNHIAIEQIFTLKEKKLSFLLALYKILKQKRYDTILIFHASQRMIFPLAKALHPRQLIGTKQMNKGLDSLFTDLLPFNSIHEIERRYLIAEHYLGKLDRKPISINISTQKLEKTAHKLYNITGSNSPYIAIQTQAKDAYKLWPAKFFQELISQIHQHYPNTPICILGSAEEANFNEQFTNHNIYNLSGKFSLKEFTAIIQNAALMITCDTGPMHIAFACKTPTIALFGPTDPAICGPYLADQNTIIRKPLPCTPCIKRKCKAPFCMQQISPNEVFTYVKEKL